MHNVCAGDGYPITIQIQFPGKQLEAMGELDWFPGSYSSDWTVDLHAIDAISLKPTPHERFLPT